MKFLCDSMFGKLSKKLRMAGYDTLYVQSYERFGMVETAIAQDRVLITGDSAVILPPRLLLYMREKDPLTQFKNVREHFNLTAENAFTRCISCNGVLEKTEKEKIKNILPPKVSALFFSFTRCTGCGKVFWQGTHWEKMKIKLKETGF